MNNETIGLNHMKLRQDTEWATVVSMNNLVNVDLVK